MLATEGLRRLPPSPTSSTSVLSALADVSAPSLPPAPPILVINGIRALPSHAIDYLDLVASGLRPVAPAATLEPMIADISSDLHRRLGLASGQLFVAFESEREPTASDKLDAKLLEYVELPYGWDGGDGRPASRAAYDDARGFLGHLKELPELPLPSPQISPDGELGLYWRRPGVFADVGFYGDGTLSFYAKAHREEFGSDAWDIAKGVPPGLIRAVGHLATGISARAA